MKQTLRAVEAKRLLERDETFATSIVAILLDEFGMECLEWDPESVRLDVRDAFGASPPQVNFDKFFGLSGILTSNLFYIDVVVFNATCQAFNDDESGFHVFTPISVEGAAWGVAEALMNDTEEPSDEKFSEEVRRFMGALVDARGLLYVPPVLSMAKPSRNQDGMLQWADDPRIYEGLVAINKSDAESVVGYVKGRTEALFKELRSLPVSVPVNLENFSIAGLK